MKLLGDRTEFSGGRRRISVRSPALSLSSRGGRLGVGPEPGEKPGDLHTRRHSDNRTISGPCLLEAAGWDRRRSVARAKTE